jgi:hypothetical protein
MPHKIDTSSTGVPRLASLHTIVHNELSYGTIESIFDMVSIIIFSTCTV